MKAFFITLLVFFTIGSLLDIGALVFGNYPLKRGQLDSGLDLCFNVFFLVWAAALLFGGAL